MPYIKSNDGRREALRKGEPALMAGELNYQIFHYVKHCEAFGFNRNNAKVDKLIIKDFVDQFLEQGKNYQRYNDMTGALVRCSLEIERRLGLNADFLLDIMHDYDDEIAEYEDLKINENGDVE